jgi:hypothetical protein
MRQLCVNLQISPLKSMDLQRDSLKIGYVPSIYGYIHGK